MLWYNCTVQEDSDASAAAAEPGNHNTASLSRLLPNALSSSWQYFDVYLHFLLYSLRDGPSPAQRVPHQLIIKHHCYYTITKSKHLHDSCATPPQRGVRPYSRYLGLTYGHSSLPDLAHGLAHTATTQTKSFFSPPLLSFIILKFKCYWKKL